LNFISSLFLSNKSFRMKFECLPNEILLICFEYFDVWDLFESFDQLNKRFNRLIRQMKSAVKCYHSKFDRLINDDRLRNQIVSLDLSNSQIERFVFDLPLIRLTLLNSSFDELNDCISNYFPLLKYLHVQYIYIPEERIRSSKSLFHLEHIIFDVILDEFEYLRVFLKTTSNLRSLTISSGYAEMLDGLIWEQLISSSLINLTKFKFDFSCYHHGRIDRFIETNFSSFQTQFWLEQHQWLTQYIITQNTISIYTTSFDHNKTVAFNYQSI